MDNGISFTLGKSADIRQLLLNGDITLTGGSHHQWHTHPLDFLVATPMGIQDGLRRAGSVLLEPMLEMRMRVPPETVGKGSFL